MTFLITAIIIRLVWHSHDLVLPGCIAMAAMLLFTSLGHFLFTKGMAMMVPGFTPFKQAIVYFTGLFEIIAAAGLLFQTTRIISGWLLILFLILMLPANINAAVQQIDYEKANYQGKGLPYLWFRVPLQLFFIAWIYIFAVHS